MHPFAHRLDPRLLWWRGSVAADLDQFLSNCAWRKLTTLAVEEDTGVDGAYIVSCSDWGNTGEPFCINEREMERLIEAWPEELQITHFAVAGVLRIGALISGGEMDPLRALAG